MAVRSLGSWGAHDSWCSGVALHALYTPGDNTILENTHTHTHTL